MSRAYRISVSDSIKRHIKVEDGIQTTLDLLPILSPERMMEMLAAELEGLGFKRDGSEAKRTDEDGVEVTVDLKTSTITARLAAESNLEITRKKNATIEEEYLDGAEAELKEKLKQELEKEADSEQDKLREEVTEQLKKKLQDLQLEMDKVINKTTSAALKEKAAQLGEIEEISEDDSGSLTIKVRV